jgi:hypothetical protein
LAVGCLESLGSWIWTEEVIYTLKKMTRQRFVGLLHSTL